MHLLLQCQNLEAAGLGCLMSDLDVWKGSTVAGPLPGVAGGRTMEVYLQRWPADKKVWMCFVCASLAFGLVGKNLFRLTPPLVVTCHATRILFVLQHVYFEVYDS